MRSKTIINNYEGDNKVHKYNEHIKYKGDIIWILKVIKSKSNSNFDKITKALVKSSEKAKWSLW